MTPNISTAIARVRWFRALTVGPKVVVGRALQIAPGPSSGDEITVTIGARSTVGTNLRVTGFGEFAVGYRTTIGDDCSCEVAGQLAISDEVTIGNRVTFHADRTRRTYVGDRVIIGDDVTIDGGAVIEDGTVVAAGAIVTAQNAHRP